MAQQRNVNGANSHISSSAKAAAFSACTGVRFVARIWRRASAAHINLVARLQMRKSYNEAYMVTLACWLREIFVVAHHRLVIISL